MRHRRNEVFVHLVWSTWDRLPMIAADIRPRLYACITVDARRCDAHVIAIGGVEDHVHVLCRASPAIAISDLVKQIKGSSSHLASHDLGAGPFKWQGGFAVASVSPHDVARVAAYIENQERHHAEGMVDEGLEMESDE